MKIIDYVIILLVVVALYFAIKKTKERNKNGCCNGNCSNCKKKC